MIQMLLRLGQGISFIKKVADWICFPDSVVSAMGVVKRVVAGAAIGTAVAGTAVVVPTVGQTISNALGSSVGSLAKDENTKFTGKWVRDALGCQLIDISANGKNDFIARYSGQGFIGEYDKSYSASVVDGRLVVSGPLGGTTYSIQESTGNLVGDGVIYRRQMSGDRVCK